MSEEEGVLLTSEVAADGCGEDSMFDPGLRSLFTL